MPAGSEATTSVQPVKETTWVAFSVRVRPSTHAKLRTIAAKTPRSANQFINDALSEILDRELERLRKIEELGLDRL